MKTIKVFQDEKYKNIEDLFGIFFEDINHAADGGLYAELVRNRSFEFCETDRKEYTPLTSWEKSDNLEWEVVSERPICENNTHYLHVNAKDGDYIRNLGYNSGIFVESGKTYDFSVYLRSYEGAGNLRVFVEDDGKNVCTAMAELSVTGCDCSQKCSEDNGFVKYEIRLNAICTTRTGRLVIAFSGGEYDVDMVSLFPTDTFRGRKNGLRKDIAEALAEMHPSFMRFPGGCLVHDGSLNENDHNSMYRWKNTVGDVHKRPSRRNNWGYNQSLGLGYYEYFLFCEDIGAKPLPVLPAGFNPHKGEAASLSDIGKWVEEALDLIEFANGDESTVWGRKRAELGHPAPFGLEYLAIGNEEIGDGFFERYPYFHKAVREKYPDIKLINSSGPFAGGEGYDAGWSSAKKWGSDLVDEHYYSTPEWFLANMHRYDDYDPNGPKVFLGEYASWGNTYYNAIVEAAYMTHLEKAPAVNLACYAPMLCNSAYVNWSPDMIWFDNAEVTKTPNYYVQKMFMNHQGDSEVRCELSELSDVINLTDKDTLCGEIAIAGNDICGKIYDISLTELPGNEHHSFDDFFVDRENQETVLARTDAAAYELSFKFKRSEGRKGLKIFFGKENTSRIMWEFGGWDNWDCNLMAMSKMGGSTISHRIFHVEDIDYDLRLLVEGRRIRTYVNGTLMNDALYGVPVLEELYVCASVSDEHTYLKVVNLTGEEKNVCLKLEGAPKTNACITYLAGAGLTDENKPGEQERIAEKHDFIKVANNELSYEFPAHSVVMFEFT